MRIDNSLYDCLFFGTVVSQIFLREIWLTNVLFYVKNKGSVNNLERQNDIPSSGTVAGATDISARHPCCQKEEKSPGDEVEVALVCKKRLFKNVPNTSSFVFMEPCCELKIVFQFTRIRQEFTVFCRVCSSMKILFNYMNK